MGLFKRISEAKKAKADSRTAIALSQADTEKAKAASATEQAKAQTQADQQESISSAESTKTMFIYGGIAVVVIALVIGLIIYFKKKK